MTIDVAEVKRRLKALLNDPNLVSDYIRWYGPTIDIKNIKELKQRTAASLRNTEGENGEDPIFEIFVTCPVCGEEEITCYELRAKSQSIVQSKFLVPRYSGALGYRTVDYTVLSVTVCPRCLFASPDKKDFTRPAIGSAPEVRSQLTANLVMTLQEKIGERRAFLKNVSDFTGYFSRPRTDDAAVAAYRLAMMRANVEAWFEQPYSLYKLGAYSLRAAKIIKDGGGDNTELLREALGYFEDTFRSSNCPSEELEMQAIYTVVALALRLGDPKKANSYLGVFANLKNARQAEMKANPKLTTVTIEKWEDRARRLWEDRDEPGLFADD